MITPKTQHTNIKIIFALTLVHFIGDFYSSFIAPLLPVFVDKLSLSMTQVGIMVGIMRFLAFIVQPSIGYVADRYPTRSFALGGLLLTVLFIPLTGLSPSFFVLTLLLAFGSVGSSMFHPSVTGMVPVYAGRNSGFSMSIFNTGGTLAFGIGPLFITWYVAQYGLSAMPATMLIGLGALIFLYRVLPMPEDQDLKTSGFINSLKDTLGEVWQAILLIWCVMVLRAVVGQSFMTFMPVLLAQKGYHLVAVGAVTSLFVVAGSLSGLTAGYLADKTGFKPIFYWTHGLMTPALLLFLNLSGSWIYLGAFTAGLFVLATLPIGVVMAQELAPRGRSMVASLMMGFAYGLGGVISPVIGKLSDLFSIQTVLLYVAFIPLLTLVIIFFFPDIGRKKHN
ncbi:MAG: MFS transporter [Deltaproteobacteria bacterium]|nr:MFS transporter [Deltaproteobacteria bacterium]MBW2563995.1 MFS transporter [Deltaproteobacteria bacterium]